MGFKASFPKQNRIDSLGAALLSVLITGTNPGLARADDGGENWILRGVAGLPPATQFEFAKSSLPLWHKVPPGPGQTIGDILAEVCGEQPPEVDMFLELSTLALNQVPNLDTVITADEVAAVPFCLKVARNVGVMVAALDSPSEILKREYGVFGPKTLEAFYELNAATYNFDTFSDFEKYLPVGEEVLVPFAAPERVFVPDPASGMAVTEIVAALAQPSLKAQIENSLAPVATAIDREPYQLRYVQSVRLEAANPSAECRGDPGQTATIVEPAAMTARYAAEVRARTAFALRDDTVPTIVGIIDSGLKAVGDGFFHEKYFPPNVQELNGVSNHDDDIPENDHKDDIYGTNFYGQSGTIEPLPTDRRKAHGTKMASLVLGGPRIAELWTSLPNEPRVLLKIVNFSSSLPSAEMVDASKLPSAIAYLKAQKADIINLSLSTPERLIPIKNAIQNNDGLLFVVAAGNAKSGPGLNLGGFGLYPARYGGSRGFSHVVTVGAHDLSGGRAVFSNYSNEFVDLLAPGCAVETRTDEGDIVLDNGTSPATAIVSFTAGLVHGIGHLKPQQIKNRLLVGTDFDPALHEDAWSSGRRDILKAISLHHDVIDTPNRTPERTFATLLAPQALLRFCAVPPSHIEPNTLRKIIPNIHTEDGIKLEYWVEIDETLSKDRCDQTAANDSIGRMKIDGQESDGPPISEVREIVLAMFIRRQ